MTPVFLLNVGVIIFVIWSTSGKGNHRLSFTEILNKVDVQELTTVIGIESKDREVQGAFNVFNLLYYPSSALIPYGTALSPTAINISNCKAPNEISG